MGHPSRALLTVSEDGYSSGRDPRTMSGADLETAGIEATPVLAAIRAKCVDCSGGNSAEVARCVAVRCALWPFRMHTNPFRLTKSEAELSDAQRTARAAFAERARLRRAASS